MQTITELAFFNVADKPVNTGQRFSRAYRIIKAQVSFDPQCLSLCANIVFQPFPPFWIKSISIGKFIQKRLKIAELRRRR